MCELSLCGGCFAKFSVLLGLVNLNKKSYWDVRPLFGVVLFLKLPSSAPLPRLNIVAVIAPLRRMQEIHRSQPETTLSKMLLVEDVTVGIYLQPDLSS